MVTNTDYLEGIYRQDFVDFWQTLSLVYRYKFATKEKHHFRDELFDYKDPTTIIINQLQADVAALNDRLDDVEDKLDTLDNRLDKIEGIMAVNGPDADNDGVPDVRDLEPYTPRANTADFWGRSMTPKSGTKAPVVSTASPFSAQPTVTAPDTEPLAVYFDFDKTDLDRVANISILRVAGRMKKDPSMLVEVRGYCDDPGSGSYNQRLSQRRAEKVKYELINTHGISPNRIVANGKGKIPFPPGRNWTNRRCDFFFSK
jgi:outer membrane protein OmpA-like peptidoglycan-associated protein